MVHSPYWAHKPIPWCETEICNVSANDTKEVLVRGPHVKLLVPFILMSKVSCLHNFIQQEFTIFLIGIAQHQFLRHTKHLMQHMHQCASQ